MKPRQMLLAFGLVVATGVALAAAHRIAGRQERRALARSAVPIVPELGLWPAEFKTELGLQAEAVRHLRDPAAALARIAQLYAANGFTREAEAALSALVRIEPGNPRWPYLLGVVRDRAGDTTGAAAAYDVCLRLAPQSVAARLRRGELQVQANDFDDAYASFTRAANAAPQDDLAAQFALARLQARSGTQGDPRTRLAALLRGHPDIRDLHELLAEVLAAAGDRKNSAEEQRRADAAPRRLSFPDPWGHELDSLVFDPVRLGALAVRRLGEGNAAEAERLLQKAIRLAPAAPRYREDLAALYGQIERAAEARATLQAAVAACPDDAGLPARLAAALRVEHRAADAVAVVRTALVRWPASAALQAQLGFALRELGENEAAVAALQASLAADPLDADVQYALASSLLASRQKPAARAAAEAALALRPDFAPALVMVGGMAVDAGDTATADRVVGRLRELKPDDPGSRLLFAGLQLKKGLAAEEAGDVEAATKLFQTGLAAAPDFTPLLREGGLLAAHRSQFKEAAELFDRYLRLERRDLRAYVWLGDALDQCDRSEEAREVYERGLALAQKAGDRTRVTELSTRLDR